jgi:Escherichia/Staphylococcus phage prohead protease
MENETIERRVFHGTVKLTRSAAKTMPMLNGHAAVFNSETVIAEGSPWAFREVIAPGAFADAIASSDVRGLFNHDANYVLGRTRSGTLRLSEDRQGLAYEIDPPDTVVGRDMVTLIQRGDIDGSSFAFTVAPDGDAWQHPGGGKLPLRTISRVSELFDVSPVTYPAYPTASVAVAEGVMRRAAARQPTRTQPPRSVWPSYGRAAERPADGQPVEYLVPRRPPQSSVARCFF